MNSRNINVLIILVIIFEHLFYIHEHSEYQPELVSIPQVYIHLIFISEYKSQRFVSPRAAWLRVELELI